jgi:hypothetical protein
MKKTNLFFLFIVLSLSSVIVSCKKDKESNPVVSVDPAPLYYYASVNDLLIFKVSVTSEVSLAKFTISSTIDNELPVTLLDSSMSSKGTNFTYYFRVPASLAGKTFVLDFRATDSNGKFGGSGKRIYVNSLPVSPVVILTETSGHRMYSNLSTTAGDAYNLETNTAEFSFTSTDTTSRDMQDFSGASTTLSKSWMSPAGGKFVVFNGYDYANATDSTCIAAYTTGVKQSVVYNLAVGDIIITKLGSLTTNKYAVIRITDIVDIVGKDNDYYEFKIKK